MRRIGLASVILLVIVGVLYGILSFVFASLVVDYRDTIDLTDSEWVAIYAPEWEVPVTETVEIEQGDVVLVADIYQNPADAGCGVIIVHGLGGFRAIGRQYGPLFWELGCDVLAYDFAPINNDTLLTYGYYEKTDLEAVLDWFAEYSDLPTEQIGIWAESYGAATALQMLPFESDVAFVVADSPYASWLEIINAQATNQFGEAITVMIPGTRVVIETRTGVSMEQVSPQNAIAMVDTPILLIHSESDELIEPYHSQMIYDQANQRTTELVFTTWGSEHTQSYYDNKAEYRQIVFDFLAEYTPDFGNQPSS